MAATTRRANPRRTTSASRPKAATEKSAPIVLDSREDDDPFAEREPLFEIDGITYTIPVVVPASYGLRYLELAVTQGSVTAMVYGMRTALGDDGYLALTSYPKLKPEHLTAISAAIRSKFDGSNAAPKAKS